MNFSGFSNAALDLACAIQNIPAPTFHEEQRAAYFLEQFQLLGLEDIHTDAAGNVLGRIPGQPFDAARPQRPLVITAHMDTVHPLGTPLSVQRVEDRLIGAGIGDNALGLAVLLTLPQMLKAQKFTPPGDIWLAANVCEEGLGDLRGIQAIVDRFQGQPLAYLVLEGMGLGTVLHRGLGVERYKITVQTPGGHSWVDYGQPSAIHELAGIITRLTNIAIPRRPCTTLNVGVIHGGTSINTIAGKAWLELDLRSEESSTLAALVKEVHQIVQNAQKQNVQVSIERIGKRQAGQIATDHPLVKLAQSVLADLNIDAFLDIASTDANLPLSRGYPAICIGITHGNNAHTLEEYIQATPVAKGLEQVYHLTTRIWGKLGG